MSFRMSTLSTLSNLSLPSPVLLCLIGHDGILFLCIWTFVEFEAHWSLWPFPIWRTWSSVMFRYISLWFLIKAPNEQKSCINYCMITNTIYINLCSALWHCNCQYSRSQCNCRRLDNKVWIPYDYGGNIWKVKGSPFVLEAYLVDTKVRWSPFSRRLFKMNFFNGNCWILHQMLLKFIANGPVSIHLFQIMNWCHTGDTPFPILMMT